MGGFILGVFGALLNNTWVMIALWACVVGMSIFVALKTKAYGVMGLGAGAIPQLIFYVYKLFNVWNTGAIAILYSRMADLALTASIIIALWMMYRSVYDAAREPTDL
jgi:hypothetical protein